MIEKKAVPHATYIVDKRRVNTNFIKMKKSKCIVVTFLAIAELADAFAPSSTVSLEQNAKVYYNHGIIACKQRVLDLLQSGENDDSCKLTPYLEELSVAYKLTGIDARYCIQQYGDWENANLPQFPGGRGHNKQGQPLYTLGRLTFNQIPKGRNVLVASEKMVQRVYPHNGNVPERLPPEMSDAITREPCRLEAFSIDTYFAVEGSNLKGVVRAQGFLFPSDTKPNTFHSFFVGGKCFSRGTTNENEWNDTFRGTLDITKSDHERVDDMLVEDTSIAYSLKTPLTSQCTVVYLDDDLRITVGQEGSRMINKRQLAWHEPRVINCND
eukprot:CAMPEP_0202505086 /NCGR_PEP_ID=MMETSP1361-20130828/46339_1 /ASSEMBLY_ACC=CAM_ASM_000849 /TAXON_ID=210615 /ORGANISM="Staurosira complex sp., Strain CCMP2646" /LENGTH=325 /DNA_ID=CAMNT_0049138759 /DNA_START=714 /DNA_END=1691 /DNA_ORIENTATION=-